MKSRINNIIIVIFLLFSVTEINGQYKKIVSLAPSITESLTALGETHHIMGVTTFCEFPKANTECSVIGSLTNLNIEKIFAIKPDLVIATKSLNKPQAISKLKSLGLNVVEVTEGDSYNEICENFISLARIIGKEKYAKSIVANIDNEVKNIQEKCKRSIPKSIFIEFGDQPLITLGNNTFSNDYLKFSSGYNIFAEMPMKYPKVNREDVLRKDPDIILIITMGVATEKEKKYWESFGNLKAVKNKRLHIVESNYFCRPTPMSFLRSLKEIAVIINPDITIK